VFECRDKVQIAAQHLFATKHSDSPFLKEASIARFPLTLALLARGIAAALSPIDQIFSSAFFTAVFWCVPKTSAPVVSVVFAKAVFDQQRLFLAWAISGTFLGDLVPPPCRRRDFDPESGC